MSDQPSSLYGNQPETPAPQAPGLMDQILGVFTEPKALFQRLNKAPSWGWALGLVIVFSMVITVIWGMKVDLDEMLRPILEKNPQLAASQVDAIIEFYKKFIIPLGIFSAAFFTPIIVCILAFVYWLVGKGLHESEPPSYRQALSATAVPSLVKLPHMLLITVICLMRPIGGLTPEKIAPTSLGFFLHAENVKTQAFLFSLDLFYLAEILLVYLAARHLLRMKKNGAILCVLVNLILSIGIQVLRAK